MQETGEFDMAVCLSIYHASKRTLLAALLVAGLAAVGSGGDAMAESRINKSIFGATAIDSYDPVAYFTMTRAVRGGDGIQPHLAGRHVAVRQYQAPRNVHG